MNKQPSKYNCIRQQIKEIRQQAAEQVDAAKSAAAKIELAAMDVLDEVNALDESVSDCAGCWCDTCTLLYACPQAPAETSIATIYKPWPCVNCERGQKHKPIMGSRCKDYQRDGHKCQSCQCYTCYMLLNCPLRPDGFGQFEEYGKIWPCSKCPEKGTYCAKGYDCAFVRRQKERCKP